MYVGVDKVALLGSTRLQQMLVLVQNLVTVRRRECHEHVRVVRIVDRLGVGAREVFDGASEHGSARVFEDLS